jgi:hypothetical protein
MAKVILICLKHPDARRESEIRRTLESLGNTLLPDNIQPRPAAIKHSNGLILAVLSPNSSTLPGNGSVCLGNLVGRVNDWWQPGGDPPDGSYALFRSSESTIELLTDIVGSRTIWYVQTSDLFIASTSQRAIVTLLGDFEPNDKAFSWMLSTGTLGPDCSWDRRIRPLGCDARLSLNRATWALSIHREPVIFESSDLSPKELKAEMRNAFDEIFQTTQLDYSKWVLPLSGGCDSRLILLLLRNREQLQTVTWGLRSAVKDRLSDAYIAERLAKHLGTTHSYFDTDVSDEPVAEILARFLVAGEGRVDHISGYMDGFKIWKTLYENNVEGIIRGDHGFGHKPVSTPLEARLNSGLLLLRDYSNTRDLNGFDLPEQEIPAELARRDNESLATWRDRLQHQFRIPCRLAALNDLKAPYVEVINPLISRKTIQLVRRFPDALRDNKSLCKEIVDSLSPNIGFAEQIAIAKPKDILRNKDIVELIADELQSANARTLFSNRLLDLALSAPQKSNTNIWGSVAAGAKQYARRFLPRGLRKFYQALPKDSSTAPSLDTAILAFRAFIICRMCQMLQADSLGNK